MDQAQLLFPWQKQKAKSKSRNEFYDEEEDDFLDETVNKKRRKLTQTSSVENYESLKEKWSKVNQELLETRIRLADIGRPDPMSMDMNDSSDQYLAVNNKKYGLTMTDKVNKSKLKMVIKHLEQEQTRIEQLMNIAKCKVVSIGVPNSNSQQHSSPTVTSKKDEPVQVEAVELNDKIAEVANSSNGIVENDNQAVEQSQPDNVEQLEVAKPLNQAPSKQRNARKLAQNSIVQAIENEKRLEKVQRMQSLCQDDSDFIDWQPPSGQAGDGKTHLNDKFGY